jgi:hypothetical protein
MSLKTSRFKPWLAIVTIAVSVSVSAQPQVPPCGTLRVSKDTKIETRLFQKGTYQIHAVGISCKEVIGRDGLFAKFLSLGDGVPLPEPWESLNWSGRSTEVCSWPENWYSCAEDI